MLSEADRTRAAEALIEAARTCRQMVQLSETWPDITIEDAYAISTAAAAGRRQQAGATLIGHKIGLTSKAMRDAVGVDEPDYGYLFDDMMVADGGAVAHAAYCAPRVEIELAFVFGAPLKGPGVGLRWVGGALYRNAEIEETGLALGVMGHPAMGIAWLANKLAPFDTVLEAGHILLSGSFTRPVWAEPGDTLRADFGALGSVAVQFT